MVEKEKRMYSLNKITFMILNGLKPLYIGYDYETDSVYYVFEENEVTKQCIKDFYCNRKIQNFLDDHELHDFLDKFKEVVKEVKKIQYEKKNTSSI